MVIQTCSQIFAVLMQMESHASFSADAIATLLNQSRDEVNNSQTDNSIVAANDRTALPFQKNNKNPNS